MIKKIFGLNCRSVVRVKGVGPFIPFLELLISSICNQVFRSESVLNPETNGIKKVLIYFIGW